MILLPEFSIITFSSGIFVSYKVVVFPDLALLEKTVSIKRNCFGNILQHQERLWCPCGFKTQIISTVFRAFSFCPWATSTLITRCWQLDTYSFAWYSTDIFKSPIIYQMVEGGADRQSFRSPKIVPSSKVALLQREEKRPNGRGKTSTLSEPPFKRGKRKPSTLLIQRGGPSSVWIVTACLLFPFGHGAPGSQARWRSYTRSRWSLKWS